MMERKIVDTENMTPQERNDANFIMNLNYLYALLGVEEIDYMLNALGTDVTKVTNL